MCYCCLEGGINGHGGGVVTSLRTFDREKQKEFHIPIVMRDSGSPSITGTSTLTVVIGDVNDNLHYAAHKEVTVYHYAGLLLTSLPGCILIFSKTFVGVANCWL
jgi:hypothetical protein